MTEHFDDIRQAVPSFALNSRVNIGANLTAKTLILKTLFKLLPMQVGSLPSSLKNLAALGYPSRQGPRY